MKKYKPKNKFSAVVVTVAVIVFIILYIVDAMGSDTRDITGECEFHFVDVGQGDCTLIIADDGVVLIDAGPGSYSDSTQLYIKKLTDKIDYFILTHPHEDHIGGAVDIIETIKVENIIMSDAATDTVIFTRLLDSIEEGEINLIEAKAGESFNAGSIDFTILSPLSEFTDLNDYSIVTKVEFGDTSAMITGDVENHSEKLIVEAYEPWKLKCDIMKMGHHGSSTSNSADFIDAVSPSFAVIQCGEGNSYGHPHRETVSKLNKRNIKFYRTDETGTVVFVSDGNEITLLDQ